MPAVDYYFNKKSTDAWTLSERMIDGDFERSAYITPNGDETEILTGNTCQGIDHGTIDKVEIRTWSVRALDDGTDTTIALTPTYDGSDGDAGAAYQPAITTAEWDGYNDVTTGTNAPSTWSWIDVDNLGVKVIGHVVTNALACYYVQIRVTYGLDQVGFIYSSTTVFLAMPSNIVESTTNSMQNLVFNDGTDVQLNRGKLGDSLTLGGMETSGAVADMGTLNGFMDDQAVVTVTGLPDTNLNTDYRISGLGFVQEAGWVDRYRYSIVLERVSDRL